MNEAGYSQRGLSYCRERSSGRPACFSAGPCSALRRSRAHRHRYWTESRALFWRLTVPARLTSRGEGKRQPPVETTLFESTTSHVHVDMISESYHIRLQSIFPQSLWNRLVKQGSMDFCFLWAGKKTKSSPTSPKQTPQPNTKLIFSRYCRIPLRLAQIAHSSVSGPRAVLIKGCKRVGL
ncbi:hypothetical protein SRHO_G00297940 [Serrasalmus rhombeus]